MHSTIFASTSFCYTYIRWIIQFLSSSRSIEVGSIYGMSSLDGLFDAEVKKSYNVASPTQHHLNYKQVLHYVIVRFRVTNNGNLPSRLGL